MRLAFLDNQTYFLVAMYLARDDRVRHPSYSRVVLSFFLMPYINVYCHAPRKTKSMGGSGTSYRQRISASQEFMQQKILRTIAVTAFTLVFVLARAQAQDGNT